MLAWLLVLSLAALQVAQAFPNPGRPQYGSLGQHGGIATEVRAHYLRFSSLEIQVAFLTYHTDRLRNVQRLELISSRKVGVRLML
jgi:hypothetical protein